MRRFLVLADRIGPPARVGAGRLAPFEDIALILPDDPADYRIYEKAGALSAALRRNVADEERGGTVPQPPCDGPIWDEVANTVLHLRFPEGVTRSKEDRLAAAAPAFELVARLRSSP